MLECKWINFTRVHAKFLHVYDQPQRSDPLVSILLTLADDKSQRVGLYLDPKAVFEANVKPLLLKLILIYLKVYQFIDVRNLAECVL